MGDERSRREYIKFFLNNKEKTNWLEKDKEDQEETKMLNYDVTNKT